MSLRNRCNQLNTVLHQLLLLFSKYKMGKEYEEVHKLIERLKIFPKLVELKPENAQTEIQFIVENTERYVEMFSAETWSDFKKSYSDAMTKLYE